MIKPCMSVLSSALPKGTSFRNFRFGSGLVFVGSEFQIYNFNTRKISVKFRYISGSGRFRYLGPKLDPKYPN